MNVNSKSSVDLHKVWLVIGIGIAVLAVLVLSFYPGEGLTGQAYRNVEGTSCAAQVPRPAALWSADNIASSGTYDAILDDGTGTPEKHPGEGRTGNTRSRTVRIAGKLGNAFKFDGGDGITNSIYIPDASSGLTGYNKNFTIEAWVKASSIPTTGLRGIVSKWIADGNQRSYLLFLNTQGKLGFMLSPDGTAANNKIIYSTAPINIDQWYHVVAIYVPGKKMQLYLNGLLESEYVSSYVPASLKSANSAPILIGTQGDLTTATMNFNGLIDEVAVYGQTLDASQVRTLYSGCKTPTGLAAGVISSTQTRVSWSPVSGATSYKLYKSTTAAGTYTFTTAATPTVDSVNAGTTYYYKVSSVTSAGESPLSAPVYVITPPNTPTGLSASAMSSTQVNVAWNAAPGATFYNLYKSTSAAGMYQAIVVTSTSKVDSVSAETTYYYKVSALNSGGESELSAPVSVSTSSNLLACKQSGWEAGKTYKLTQDITAPSGDCMVFNVDNVVLNCQGKKIIGVSGSNAAIKAIGRKNIKVANCTITGYNDAVYLDGTESSYLSGNNFSSCNTGINILRSRGNTIFNNTLDCPISGISLTNANSNLFRNNTIKYAARGVDVKEGSNTNTFQGNLMVGNTNAFYLQSTGSNNVFEDNKIIFNTPANNEKGFFLVGTNAPILNNNLACGTGSQKSFDCGTSASAPTGGLNLFSSVVRCSNNWPELDYDYSSCPVCGNSNVDSGEACDDGNAVSGDGCSASCTKERGYSCPANGGACTRNSYGGTCTSNFECGLGKGYCIEGQCRCEAPACHKPLESQSLTRCQGSINIEYCEDADEQGCGNWNTYPCPGEQVCNLGVCQNAVATPLVIDSITLNPREVDIDPGYVTITVALSKEAYVSVNFNGDANFNWVDYQYYARIYTTDFSYSASSPGLYNGVVKACDDSAMTQNCVTGDFQVRVRCTESSQCGAGASCSNGICQTADSDGDGVEDSVDACLGTPRGKVVFHGANNLFLGCIIGDIDDSQTVDDNDINPFIIQYRLFRGQSDISSKADIDENNIINDNDINPFIIYWRVNAHR